MSRRPASLSLSLLAAATLAGCASEAPQPQLRREYDPKLEEEQKQKDAAEAARGDLGNVLLQLDLALDSYVKALNNSGVSRYDEERGRIEKLLRQLVSGKPPGSNTQKLIALASDSTDPWFQGIALAALGFADSGDVMPVILQGAQLADPHLVDRAVLGLAILRDPRTPPGVIAAVVENPKLPEQSRISAAWALVTLQEKCTRVDEIVPVWTRLLDHADDTHPLVIANAVRGLGLTRDAKHADLVARYLSHPTPRVRINAAIALGRMNAQAQHEKLIALLEPSESVPNVRLAARKALQALAGNVDRGYDVALWRREFERAR